MLRLAASSPWPILIFWGLFMLFARAAKKKKEKEKEKAQARGSALQTRTEVRARQDQALKGRASARASAERVLQHATDYDEEAIRLEESRVREEAEAFERIDAAPSPRLVASQSLAGSSSVHPPIGRNALARFADGSLTGAVVLSEILGRPIADR